MKYTIELERVTTHTIILEVEADSEDDAESRGDQLISYLEYHPTFRHTTTDSIVNKDDLVWIKEQEHICSGGWDLEDEQFTVINATEGGL